MKKKSVIKKIWSIICNVVLYLFLFICLTAVIFTVASKKDIDGAANLFGYQMRIVTSDSMAECELTDVSSYEIGSIPLRSMLFIEHVPEDAAEADEWYSQLNVGDVLTFRYVYTSQVTITHRIVSIEAKETGGYLIELAGDNKSSETGQLVQLIDTSEVDSPNYVIGKVVGQNYPLGYLVSLLKEPIGIVLIVIVPCFIVILYEVIKIVSVLGAEKKAKAQIAEEQKDNEIEELRRKLAALENSEATAPTANDPKASEEKTDTPTEELQSTESVPEESEEDGQ